LDWLVTIGDSNPSSCESGIADEAGDARASLRAKARRLGILASRPAAAVTEEQRTRAIDATAGLGPVLDGLLAEGR
jgi:hypothetical protein